MTTPLRALALAPILLIANNSYGRMPVPDKSWPRVECVSLEQLNSEIRWCTDNAKAVAYAEDCAKQLSQAWDAAARDLKKLSGEGGSQSADLGRSGSKYQSTIDRMAYLTGQLMRSADLIAKYPEVMADQPGRTDVGNSAPCYQNAFKMIQGVVSDLDKRSREGVGALMATSELHSNVVARKADIESNTLMKKVAGGKGAAGAPARVPASVRQKNGASDITGTEKKKNKL